MTKEDNFLGMRGDPKVWRKFMKKVKKEHKTAWGVLEPGIKEFLKKK